MTTRAWIRWAEAQMRQERALVADQAASPSRSWVPDDREPAVSLVEPVEPVEPAEARRTPILVGIVAVAVALVLVLAAGVWWWGEPLRHRPDGPGPGGLGGGDGAALTRRTSGRRRRTR